MVARVGRLNRASERGSGAGVAAAGLAVSAATWVATPSGKEKNIFRFCFKVLQELQRGFTVSRTTVKCL